MNWSRFTRGVLFTGESRYNAAGGYEMTYLVAHAPTPDDLATTVNEALRKGWELQGGVAVVAPSATTGGTFFQAMVLRS